AERLKQQRADHERDQKRLDHHFDGLGKPALFESVCTGHAHRSGSGLLGRSRSGQSDRTRSALALPWFRRTLAGLFGTTCGNTSARSQVVTSKPGRGGSVCPSALTWRVSPISSISAPLAAICRQVQRALHNERSTRRNR